MRAVMPIAHARPIVPTPSVTFVIASMPSSANAIQVNIPSSASAFIVYYIPGSCSSVASGLMRFSSPSIAALASCTDRSFSDSILTAANDTHQS